jgi:hypothetical protein
LLSEDTTNAWFSYFTRIGFLEVNKRQTEIINAILNDSVQRLYIEKQKPPQNRDENLILRIKKDIRENSGLLTDYSLGTPVLSAVKSRLEKMHQRVGTPT